MGTCLLLALVNKQTEVHALQNLYSAILKFSFTINCSSLGLVVTKAKIVMPTKT